MSTFDVRRWLTFVVASNTVRWHWPLTCIGRSTDEHIDKTIVKELVSDEDALIAKQEAKAEKKQRKADQKLRERLKAERKKEANKRDNTKDDDDEADIDKFAKGSRGKAKTK